MKLNQIFENETIKKLATSTALTAAVLAGSGCSSLDKRDGARLGGAIAGLGCVAASEMVGGKEATRIARGAGLGILCREAGQAMGRHMAPDCDRNIVIDNRTGRVTRDRSDCDTRHNIPSGTPSSVYSR